MVNMSKILSETSDRFKRMIGLLVSMNKYTDAALGGVDALKTTTTEVEDAKRQEEASTALDTLAPRKALHVWPSVMKLEPVTVRVLPG